MRFDTILIANRGEIAVRIIKTAKALGYRTVAVYSDADRDALHAAKADVAVCIGPAQSTLSYLNMDKVIAAAQKTGAGAIHPGYGFLSENAEFAQACVDAGLVFIGPSPDAIRAMGDKATAKTRMLSANVPCVPGYHCEDQSTVVLRTEAAKIGYPVMIKASAGGGGKGMRLVSDTDAFDDALALAKTEALAAFGSETMILERAILAPRHVEVQVFGDLHGNIIHLGERDCSVQRRHQKVLEETPSPAVNSDLRERMGAAAVAAAQAIGYHGAGTVEFLLDQSGEFFFLEMNTRLQVEHPVTEIVTGTDLVAWQIAVAQGDTLPIVQEQVTLSGWAIEARLYAEDPGNGFLPSAGRILHLDVPDTEGVRIDTGVVEGDEVSPHYDPMLAKIIAHGETREISRQRLVRVLQDMVIFGPKTNRSFLIKALDHSEFATGAATTAFVETCFPPQELEENPPKSFQIALATAVLYLSGAAQTRPRLSRPAHYLFMSKDQPTKAQVTRTAKGLRVQVNQQDFVFETFHFDGHTWRTECDGVLFRGAAHITGRSEVWLEENGHVLHLRDTSLTRAHDAKIDVPGQIRAPMHGRLVELRAEVGDVIAKDQPVLVLEAMKMQHMLLAGQSGVLDELRVAVGDQVEAGQVLAEIINKTSA